MHKKIKFVFKLNSQFSSKLKCTNLFLVHQKNDCLNRLMHKNLKKIDFIVHQKIDFLDVLMHKKNITCAFQFFLTQINGSNNLIK